MSSHGTTATLPTRTSVPGAQPLVPSGTSLVLTTSSMCVNSHAPILMQTAKATVYDATQQGCTSLLEFRIILDAGRQRSYVTTRILQTFSARKSHYETIIIKIFGSKWGERRVLNVIQVNIVLNDSEPLVLPMVFVPHICNHMDIQPINTAMVLYWHLSGLELAGSGDAGIGLEFDLLIGANYYWKLDTGWVVREDGRPMAFETRLGWVLSEQAKGLPEETAIHQSLFALAMCWGWTAPLSWCLDADLKKFYELESLKILEKEYPVQQQFSQQITFKGEGYYQLHLSLKDSQPPNLNYLTSTCTTYARSDWGPYSRSDLRILNSSNSMTMSSRTNSILVWWRLLENLPTQGWKTSLSPTSRSILSWQADHKFVGGVWCLSQERWPISQRVLTCQS